MTPHNLLVLLSDEHNPHMLGCAGHPMVRTPHLVTTNNHTPVPSDVEAKL